MFNKAKTKVLSVIGSTLEGVHFCTQTFSDSVHNLNVKVNKEIHKDEAPNEGKIRLHLMLKTKRRQIKVSRKIEEINTKLLQIECRIMERIYGSSTSEEISDGLTHTAEITN